MKRCSKSRLSLPEVDVQHEKICCESFRTFSCGYCGRENHICSCCDHGHKYCIGMPCAFLGRQRSQKQTRLDYQKTKKGRRNHAASQKRYRERKQALVSGFDKKVMDHPSPKSYFLLKVNLITPTLEKLREEIYSINPESATGLVRCCCCGWLCGPFRHGWDDW